MTQAMTTLTNAIDEFIANHEAIGTTEHTVRAYRSHMERFRDFLIADGLDAEMPNRAAVRAWRDDLVASGLKPTTIKRYLGDVGIFFKWLCGEDMDVGVGANPVNAHDMPRTKADERRPYSKKLTPDQVAALFRNDPPENYSALYWPRNYALVTLLLTSGLRNNEVASLTLSDVDFEHREITVRHGKGDKMRFVDLAPVAESALKLYLASGFRPERISHDAPLFGTNYGGKWSALTTRAILNLVNEHVCKVTGVSDMRCHDLRHICARDDLNSGMSIEELSSKLGHSLITTTQRYSGRLECRRERSEISVIAAEQRVWAERNNHMLKEAV